MNPMNIPRPLYELPAAQVRNKADTSIPIKLMIAWRMAHERSRTICHFSRVSLVDWPSDCGVGGSMTRPPGGRLIHSTLSVLVAWIKKSKKESIMKVSSMMVMLVVVLLLMKMMMMITMMECVGQDDEGDSGPESDY